MASWSFMNTYTRYVDYSGTPSIRWRVLFGDLGRGGLLAAFMAFINYVTTLQERVTGWLTGISEWATSLVSSFMPSTLYRPAFREASSAVPDDVLAWAYAFAAVALALLAINYAWEVVSSG